MVGLWIQFSLCKYNIFFVDIIRTGVFKITYFDHNFVVYLGGNVVETYVELGFLHI
jgi:hypothetical protein